MNTKQSSILKRHEWIPFLIGFLLRVVVVATTERPSLLINAEIRAFLVGFSVALMLFGVGAVLWRLQGERGTNKVQRGLILLMLLFCIFVLVLYALNNGILSFVRSATTGKTEPVGIVNIVNCDFPAPNQASVSLRVQCWSSEGYWFRCWVGDENGTQATLSSFRGTNCNFGTSPTFSHISSTHMGVIGAVPWDSRIVENGHVYRLTLDKPLLLGTFNDYEQGRTLYYWLALEDSGRQAGSLKGAPEPEPWPTRAWVEKVEIRKDTPFTVTVNPRVAAVLGYQGAPPEHVSAGEGPQGTPVLFDEKGRCYELGKCEVEVLKPLKRIILTYPFSYSKEAEAEETSTNRSRPRVPRFPSDAGALFFRARPSVGDDQRLVVATTIRPRLDVSGFRLPPGAVARTRMTERDMKYCKYPVSRLQQGGGVPAGLRKVIAHSNGEDLIVLTDSGEVYLTDVGLTTFEKMNAVPQLGKGDRMWASPDCKQLAIFRRQQKYPCQIVDLHEGTEILCELDIEPRSFRELVFANEKRLFVVSKNKCIEVNVDTGKPANTARHGLFNSILVSGDTLYGRSNGILQSYNLLTGEKSHLWRIGRGVEMLQVSSDQSLICIKSGHDLEVWDISSQRKVCSFVKKAHAGMFNAPVAFSPDGELLAVTCGRREVRVGNIATGEFFFSAKVREKGGIAFAADGCRLITYGERDPATVYDVDTAKVLAKYLRLEL